MKKIELPKDSIIAYYVNQNLGINKISYLFNVSRWTITERLKEWGIEIKHREAQKGINHHQYKGKFINSDGYIKVYCPNHPYAINNHVLEHRLIMEQIIGRYLFPHEIVHHKNEIKTDNKPENLELTTQSMHAKNHQSLPKFKKLTDKQAEEIKEKHNQGIKNKILAE